VLSFRYEATIVTGLGKAACGASATLKIQILQKFDIHYIKCFCTGCPAVGARAACSNLTRFRVGDTTTVTHVNGE